MPVVLAAVVGAREQTDGSCAKQELCPSARSSERGSRRSLPHEAQAVTPGDAEVPQSGWCALESIACLSVRVKGCEGARQRAGDLPPACKPLVEVRSASPAIPEKQLYAWLSGPVSGRHVCNSASRLLCHSHCPPPHPTPGVQRTPGRGVPMSKRSPHIVPIILSGWADVQGTGVLGVVGAARRRAAHPRGGPCREGAAGWC